MNKLFVSSVIIILPIIWIISDEPKAANSFQPSSTDFNTTTKISDSTKPNGKELFKMCGNCHGITKDITGPALAGVDKRWPDKNRLYQFVRNPGPFFSTDDYAKKLLKKWKTIKPSFMLSDEELEALFSYIKSQEKKNT